MKSTASKYTEVAGPGAEIDVVVDWSKALEPIRAHRP